MKKHVFLTFCFLLSVFSMQSCSQPTDNPDEKITYSGTVKLAGEEDHSGITVSLYKPVEIDPKRLAFNQDYPNIGIVFTQKTEFSPWNETPVYSTQTTADGDWQIPNVADQKYHLVAEKPGFGYQVIYNSADVNTNVELARSIKLSGNYYDDIEIAGDSFVEIESDVFLLNNAKLKINPGTILQFKNNSSMSIEGNLICLGNSDNYVRIYNESTSFSNKITVKNSNLCRISHTFMSNIKNGIFLSSVDSISTDNIRVDQCDIGVELFNCGEISILSSNFLNTQTAITIDINYGLIEKNILDNCSQYGIKIVNSGTVDIKYNLIQGCGLIGIASNPIQFPTQKNNLDIEKNDLVSNEVNIYLGALSGARANYNNILSEATYLVRVAYNSGNDTLNFQNNFWGETQDIDIATKIEDYTDTGRGVTIDYANFLFEKYVWQSDLQ